MGKSIYQIVNEKIVEALKKGVIPWRKPWRQAGVPSNFISKKAYRGINVFLLAMQGFASPYWLSFKQCAGLGGQVRKGEKATLVIYWKILERKEAGRAGDGASVIKKIPLLRYYQVFNVEQCEGLKIPEAVEGKLEFEPVELAEAVRDGYMDAPDYQERENSAYYSPARDLVNLPKKENFKSVPAYYATLFHELVHSTGHGDRLNREGFIDGASFGSDKYSKEELVAEFGASFLCGLCGIESELENSASYISGWMQKIAENEKWLVTSATQAQKAVEYMLGTYYGQAVEAVPAVEAEPVEAVAEFSTGADSYRWDGADELDELAGTIGYHYGDIRDGLAGFNWEGVRVSFKAFSEFQPCACKCGQVVYRHASTEGQKVYCYNCGRAVEAVRAGGEFSTGLDCNACGENIDDAEQCDNIPVLCSADVASICRPCHDTLAKLEAEGKLKPSKYHKARAERFSIPCAMCGQELGEGRTYCADCDYCNGEGFTGRGTVEDEGGEFSTGIKSLAVGELVKLKDGKIGEVLEVSEDGKACKVHIRTGERVPDKFYQEYELKKGGV